MSALIIFIKNPEKGKAKTRLAKSIGDDQAHHVYKLLLAHTRDITGSFQGEKYLYYSDFLNWNDEWPVSGYKKRLQQGEHLGERMIHAFTEVFNEGHNQAMIIGSDCYELSTALIDLAADALIKTDVVIGPANDGGYYLLGMKKLQRGLFDNVAWSTDSVFAQTVAALESLKLRYEKLQVLHDIDTLDDLQRSGLKYQ